MLIGACDDKRNLADRADVTTRHIRGLMVMAAKHEEAFSEFLVVDHTSRPRR